MNTLLAPPPLTAGNATEGSQVYAISMAQAAFEGAAEAMHIKSEEDVQELVNEIRYGKD